MTGGIQRMMEGMDRATANLLQGEWDKESTGNKVLPSRKSQFYNLSTPPY